MLSDASEQDVCLLHEDYSDQSMCSCSSSTDGGGDDLENLTASSSLQRNLTWKRWETMCDDNGSVCAISHDRASRLVRNKRSFGELWNQKGECAIPCDKQLCSFLKLSEPESTQTRSDGQR